MKKLFILFTIVALTSCATSKSCHTKGFYVDKSVKRAQAKPHAH
jgi:hypothetical protein